MRDLTISPPASSTRRMAPGIWLIGILGLSIFVAGIVLVASVESLPQPRMPAPAAAAISVQAGGAPIAGAIDIPGFQRRGNTLVGEVVTRDGASLRLVFDAHTKTLIGLRMISPPAGASAQR